MKKTFHLLQSVKKARVASGMSQEDLAKKLGVSDKTISAYETGRAIPPTPTVTKIAALTNTPISELLGIKEDDSENKLFGKLDQLIDKMSAIEQELKKINDSAGPNGLHRKK